MITKERLLKTILLPHFSEKATLALENNNTYVFKVSLYATKPVVKAAIEHLFNVTVDGVRIVRLKPKQRLFKGIKGKKKAIKKAYVKLQAGQTIDLAGISA
ncbi:MAG: 50S ribosomal protein L23 [uncultured bacterium]|nr:MAG: 50S ribosomal protein L23 [uncultured bacterium]OGT58575.1 MAG: 50S ribosomal protein L23 [Gammaproteobacteria bacterium RIFCSPHIGHO2_12_FULL_42_10]